MGVEEEEAQPRKNNNRRYVETLLGWASEASAGSRIYETALVTSLLEYSVVLFFGVWSIVEYYHNVYEQQYFGSFNPVFLIILLMAASGYGFARLVSMIRNEFKPAKRNPKAEDDY